MFRRRPVATPKSVDERLADLTDQIRSDQQYAHNQRVKFESRMRRTGYPVAVAAGLLGLAATLGAIHQGHAPKNLAATILEGDVPVDTSPVSVKSWLEPALRSNPTAEQIASDTQNKIRTKATKIAQKVVRHYVSGRSDDTAQLSKDPLTGQVTDILVSETAKDKAGETVQTQIDLGVKDYKITSIHNVTVGVVQKDPLTQPDHTIIMQRQTDAEGNPSWSIDIEEGVDHPALTMGKLAFRQTEADELLHQLDTY